MVVVDTELSSCEPFMADLAPMHTAHKIIGLEFDGQGVTLRWDDEYQSRYHVLWLRDNCACPQCRHPQALERTFMFIDHPFPTINSAALDPDEVLEVEFQTEHVTHVARYSKGWLRDHDYSVSVARAADDVPRHWDASIAASLPRFEYEDYMRTKGGLRAWIAAMKTHGIVLLRNVPQKPGMVLEVARRIGPVRASNFGEYYDVISMRNPNASAYTQMGLELHTDLANWRVPPDVQLLSCLKSSVVGGNSIFADGFKVAEDLRMTDKDAFNLLSKHAIEFRFQDADSDIRATAPVIEVDRAGRLTRIRFNNWLRSAMSLPNNLIEPMYQALEQFWRMLRNPNNRLDLRLEPGDLIAYNNNRVLHGRAAFDATAGERHLQGCYLNQEDVDSALRLLDRS